MHQTNHFYSKSFNIKWNSPRSIKTARVKPLFKTNSRLDIGNYRPVSILCIISKILEKSVYNQIENYLVANNLLYQLKSRLQECFFYRYLSNPFFYHIKKNTSKGLFTVMVMIDLQKAFDTADHQKLCDKLEMMEVKNQCWRSHCPSYGFFFVF